MEPHARYVWQKQRQHPSISPDPAFLNAYGGYLSFAQGAYGEAEPLYQRALAASEQVLGAEHPDTLGSVNNLALLYASQERYGEAETLYQRAVFAAERVLGPNHPYTKTFRANWEQLSASQGLPPNRGLRK